MSTLRYISIFIFISIYIFQSTFMTLSALTESGRIINSIKDLQVKSEIPKDTESVIIENK